MKAYIKKIKWQEFKENYLDYNFTQAISPKHYIRVIDKHGLFLVINKITREMQVTTPMGSSPFIEAHKDKYRDLLDLDYIEYMKGKFD
jgi:hypothetical protein